MVPTIEPVRLVGAQRNQAAEMLVEAFAEDPMYQYVFPDIDERRRALRRLWSALLVYNQVYGEIYTTPEVKGVACWLSPGKTDVTWWRMLRTRLVLGRALMRFGRRERRRFLDILSFMEQVHKRQIDGPHWYLSVLGVEPSYQAQGIGSRLLAPVLSRSDDEGVPCYLETVTEENVSFYSKRGFEVASQEEVHGLKIWTMLREPQARSASQSSIQ